MYNCSKLVEREREGAAKTPQKLGRKLSALEERCYRIVLNSPSPILAKDLYKELYPDWNGDLYIDAEDAGWKLISRLRDKLGETEIITIPRKGYVSRRKVIFQMVEANRADSVGVLGI